MSRAPRTATHALDAHIKRAQVGNKLNKRRALLLPLIFSSFHYFSLFYLIVFFFPIGFIQTPTTEAHRERIINIRLLFLFIFYLKIFSFCGRIETGR